MNYAEKDKQNIIEFVKGRGGESSVDDILNLENVEKLRVYPLIYRMKEAGIITITAYGELGDPTRIKLLQA